MESTQQNDHSAVWDKADLLSRVDNDLELLRDLLLIFQEEFPRTLRSLETAVASEDLKCASSLSHKLKGMLSNLGGVRAASAAAKLEMLASAGDKSSLKEAFSSLARESATLLPEFETYMNGVHS